MPPIPANVFANRPETRLFEDADTDSRVLNLVLLGTYLDVIDESGDFYSVETRRAGPGGFVLKNETRETPMLKMFFVDVGQGDGTLIESPQGIIVVDGGQGRGFHAFLRHRYRPLIDAGETVEIAAMVMSHPDADHYKGLEPILEDTHFRVGTIYHNGLMRYSSTVENSRNRMITNGHLEEGQIDGEDAFLVTDLVDGLDSILTRLGDMPAWFRGFWEAARDARDANRLDGAAALAKDGTLAGFTGNGADGLNIEVLGPVLTDFDSKPSLLAFGHPKKRHLPRPDYPHYHYSHSHTRNGHSVVLRLEFGDHKALLGGDLNIPAEQHLLDHYGDANPFRVDVAKACHHGSSDFSVEFLKKVAPHATTISSGDNKSFDHPMADALGTVSRHSRGDHPLVFSTELGRAYQVDGDRVEDIHYGLVNLRSNGSILTMAQMKEQKDRADVWDSFTVPWPGAFWYERS
jgi:beta-lactamase superfamily II metal-dependent hydrolase